MYWCIRFRIVSYNCQNMLCYMCQYMIQYNVHDMKCHKIPYNFLNM